MTALTDTEATGAGGQSEPLVAQPAPADRQGAISNGLRVVVWIGLATLVFVVPFFLEQFHSRRWSLAVIYAIVALSLNVLIGHAGQISLGHQGFLGVGAFTSAYVVSAHDQTVWVGLVAGALSGAVASLVMGVVALRVRGLYLALVTLAYGRMAQDSIFNLSIFGAGAGVEAPRPDGIGSERAYYFLCLAMLALVLFLDWRFTATKAGRAVGALRENEQVAASYGISVGSYKLYAFVLSGIFVGLAGALFAHRNGRVVGNDFEFQLALFFVIVTVVGGVRSRPGVVVWTLAFTLIPEYLRDNADSAPFLSLAVGAVLLIVILAVFPGGIGQLIKPVTRWLTGERFRWELENEYVQQGVSGRP
jgi:branched-chain amino acid transport system permease protein